MHLPSSACAQRRFRTWHHARVGQLPGQTATPFHCGCLGALARKGVLGYTLDDGDGRDGDQGRGLGHARGPDRDPTCGHDPVHDLDHVHVHGRS